MYTITSLDRQKFGIKMTCRYPSVVGQILKYIPIPIKDDDDVDIMFTALFKHLELSNIDLYLESEAILIDIGNTNQLCRDEFNFEESHGQENRYVFSLYMFVISSFSFAVGYIITRSFARAALRELYLLMQNCLFFK